MATILQTTSSNIFPCVKIAVSWFQISLKFVPKGPLNNSPALVETMTWHRTGEQPLSQPMTPHLLTHIYASLGLYELTQRGLNDMAVIL